MRCKKCDTPLESVKVKAKGRHDSNIFLCKECIEKYKQLKSKDLDKFLS